MNWGVPITISMSVAMPMSVSNLCLYLCHHLWVLFELEIIIVRTPPNLV